MHFMSLKKTIASLIVAVTVTACVEAPSEALSATDPPNNPLAASFDILADEQLSANDVERAEEFRWAALAVRAGVTPSVLNVTNGSTSETYDAFVHAAAWATLTQALRPPQHRSLIAWRRVGDVHKVILIGSLTDSAIVLNPHSLRPSASADPAAPFAGAKAAYFERGPANTSWVGVGGFVQIAEHPQPAACPTTNNGTRPEGVNCQTTRYGVRFNVQFAQTRGRDSRDVAPQAPTRRILADKQTVAGAKLVFTCAMPLSTGC
jgi:hypothetical protein